MNRGLALALLLLAFVVTVVGAGTVLTKESLEKNEAVLSSLDPKEPSSAKEVVAVRSTFEESRFLFAVTVPFGILNEYEEALSALDAAAPMAKTQGEKQLPPCHRSQQSDILSNVRK